MVNNRMQNVVITLDKVKMVLQAPKQVGWTGAGWPGAAPRTAGASLLSLRACVVKHGWRMPCRRLTRVLCRVVLPPCAAAGPLPAAAER